MYPNKTCNCHFLFFFRLPLFLVPCSLFLVPFPYFCFFLCLIWSLCNAVQSVTSQSNLICFFFEYLLLTCFDNCCFRFVFFFFFSWVVFDLDNCKHTPFVVQAKATWNLCLFSLVWVLFFLILFFSISRLLFG